MIFSNVTLISCSHLRTSGSVRPYIHINYHQRKLDLNVGILLQWVKLDVRVSWMMHVNFLLISYGAILHINTCSCYFFSWVKVSWQSVIILLFLRNVWVTLRSKSYYSNKIVIFVNTCFYTCTSLVLNVN